MSRGKKQAGATVAAPAYMPTVLHHITNAGTCRSSIGGYTHTMLMRWCGFNGWSINTTAGVMALIGVPTRLNTVRNQVGSGRAGEMSYHGEVPGLKGCPAMPGDMVDWLNGLKARVEAMPVAELQASVAIVLRPKVTASQRGPSLTVPTADALPAYLESLKGQPANTTTVVSGSVAAPAPVEPLPSSKPGKAKGKGKPAVKPGNSSK